MGRVLLLLLFAVLLASIQASASQDAVFDFSLAPGFNLIGIPVQIDATASAIADVINKQGGNVVSVMSWNPASNSFVSWSAAAPKLNDFKVEGGKGYYVRTAKAVKFQLSGRSFEEPSTYEFSSGTQLVGFHFVPKGYTASDLAADIESSGGKVNSIMAFSREYTSWLPRFPKNNDFSIEMGKGYLLQLSKPATITIERSSKPASVGVIIQVDEPSLAALSLTPSVQQQPLQLHEEVKKQLVQKFSAVSASANGNSYQIKHEFVKIFNGFALDVPYEEAKKLFAGIPGVKRITPDYIVSADLLESIPQINADEAWQLSDGSGQPLTGKGVVIAIVDTGVDYTHPDLGGCTSQEFLSGDCEKVIGGYDTVHERPDSMDDHGHGTLVAGVAASNGQRKGVAPNASILSYKVLNDAGNGELSDIFWGIELAMDPDGDGSFSDRADVIVVSLGLPCKLLFGSYISGFCGPDDDFSQLANAVSALGTVFVAAAGNNGDLGAGSISSPATAEKAITVGSVSKSDVLSGFSSRGPVPINGQSVVKPEVVAPGEGIVAQVPGGYASASGTSLSAPHVAGAAALILQKNPGWTPEQVKLALMETAVDLGYDENSQGAGRIDVLAAVQFRGPADLAVTDIRWNPENPKIGEQVTVEAVVENIGGAEIGSFSYQFGFSDDGGYPGNVWASGQPVPEGQSVTLTASHVFDNEGKYDIMFRITSKDDQDAGNNERIEQLSFTVESVGYVVVGLKDAGLYDEDKLWSYRYLGNQLVKHKVYSFGAHSSLHSLYNARIDNDPYDDIVAFVNGKLTVFWGALGANFEGPKTHGTTASADISKEQAVAIADLDGNGHNDFLVMNTANRKVHWLPGNGQREGNFQSEEIIIGGSYEGINAIAAASVTDDENVDVIVAASDGLYLYPGKGDGSFSEPIIFSEPDLRSVAVIDVSGSARKAIAATKPSKLFLFVLNNDGTLYEQVSKSVFTRHDVLGDISAPLLRAGDFNADGRADLAIRGLAGVSVAYGSDDAYIGPISFTDTTEGTDFALGIGIAKLNADGMDDIVSITSEYSFASSKIIGIFPPSPFEVTELATIYPVPIVIIAGSVQEPGVDLAVEKFSISPANPEEGQTVTFTAVVRNTGTEDVAGFSYRVTTGDQDVIEGDYAQLLRMGNAATITQSYIYGHSGSYVAKFLLTNEDVNNDNNEKQKSVVVSEPADFVDILVQSFTVVTSPALEGQPTAFEAIIRNDGALAAPGFAYLFDFGDGSPPKFFGEGTIIEAGRTAKISQAHVYRQAGDYSVRIRIFTFDDVNRNNDQASTDITVEEGIPCGSYGDVDYSMTVDSVDVNMVMAHIVGKNLLSGEALIRADVNGDGKVNVLDTVLIKRYIAGIITSWPVCQ